MVLSATTNTAPPGALSKEMVQAAEPRVRIITTVEEMEAIRPVWSLWKGHRDADIDLNLTILRCSASTRPHVIVVERNGIPDTILVGRATTTTLRHRIGYLSIPVSGVRVLDFVYGGLLGDQSDENTRLIVNEIRRSLCGGEADVAVLSYVNTDLALFQMAAHVDSALMRDNFRVTQIHCMMLVPKTPDEVFAALSREARKHIRADAKKFRTAFPDLRIARLEGPDRLEELIRDAEQVTAKTYQRGLGVGFSDAPIIREMLGLEARKGWLRGYVLYLGDQPCAYWIGSIYNGAFLSEYLAHDPAYGKYSPGTFLLMHGIEELCREGVAAIDFGIGDALYKRRFGSKQWNESTVCLYAPRWTGMRVKALGTAALLVDRTIKALLEKTNLAGRIKKLWRQHAAHRTHSV